MVPIFTAGRIAGHIQPYEGVTEHDYPDFRFLGIMKRKKRSPRAASKKIGE